MTSPAELRARLRAANTSVRETLGVDVLPPERLAVLEHQLRGSTVSRRQAAAAAEAVRPLFDGGSAGVRSKLDAIVAPALGGANPTADQAEALQHMSLALHGLSATLTAADIDNPSLRKRLGDAVDAFRVAPLGVAVPAVLLRILGGRR